jgi:hypothetical protein
MSLRAALLLTLLVLLSALPAGAASPTGAPAGASERVQLRWKVPKGAPLGYEYVTQSVAGSNALRLDTKSLKDAGIVKQRRRAIFDLKLPPEMVMAAVLSSKGGEDLSAKVLVTRLDTRKMPRKSKMEREVAKMMEGMVGTVQARATLTGWGLVTSELKREQRNLVAIMFELPARPVAVGDTWTHSADLVKMGEGFEGKSEVINRVEFVALEKEAEGRTVAVIDFTLAERHDGQFMNRGLKKPVPSFMEVSHVGRGEFLVEEGRWRKLAGRMTTKAGGVATMDSEAQFSLTPLDPIPPQVLATE